MSTDILPKVRDGAGASSIVVDGISYIPSSALLTGIDKVNFKGNRAFGVLDPSGEAPRLYSPGSELGYFYNDTRYLSVWETLFNGRPAIPLARELRAGGSVLVFSMTNADIETSEGVRIPRDTF